MRTASPTTSAHPFGDSKLQVAVIAPGPVPWDEDDDRTIVCTLQGTKPLKGSRRKPDLQPTGGRVALTE